MSNSESASQCLINAAIVYLLKNNILGKGLNILVQAGRGIKDLLQQGFLSHKIFVLLG